MSGSKSGSSPHPKRNYVKGVDLLFQIPLEVAAKLALPTTQLTFAYAVPEDEWKQLTAEERLHILKIVAKYGDRLPPPMVLKAEHIWATDPESDYYINLNWQLVLAHYWPDAEEEKAERPWWHFVAVGLVLAVVGCFIVWASRGH